MMHCEKGVYLFGSALYSENPRDLDILVVYRESTKVENALRFREKLGRKLYRYTGLAVHFVMLSAKEEREVDFINCEKCRILTRRQVRELRKIKAGHNGK